MEMERSALEEDLDGQEDACVESCALYCGNDRLDMAPCTYCEWAGICPQHYHEDDENAPGN